MIKTNTDFVTNSSSTCFVLSLKKEKDFSFDDLLKAVGVNHGSSLESFYKDLFDQIQENKEMISDLSEIEDGRGASMFSEKEMDEIQKRFKSGEEVYMGNIDDHTVSGSYYLGKRVIIIGDDFYFNWEPNAF